MTTDDTWRKASRSENGPNCVELLGTLDHLRDSKNPTGPTLPGNIAALISAAKTNHFRRHAGED